MCEVMQLATKKITNNIKGKELEKLLAVVNPTNGIDFFANMDHKIARVI